MSGVLCKAQSTYPSSYISDVNIAGVGGREKQNLLTFIDVNLVLVSIKL